MKRLLSLVLLVVVSLALSGCGDKNKDSMSSKDKDQKVTPPKDDAHKDHKHSDGGDKKDGGHHEGEKHNLGTVKAGAHDITVIQIGHVEKGEGVLEIKVGGITKGAATVRAWAGTEDAKGAAKAKAAYVADEDMFDVHVEVGSTLPAGAKWWVEVEPTGAKAVTASFDIEDH